MRERHKPRIHHKHDLHFKNNKIGYLQLVDYMCGKMTPHIEYHLEPEYRNKGIMTKELPKYLKQLKKWKQYRLIALTDEDNIASIKLLEKNGFIFCKQLETKSSYICDLLRDKNEIEIAMKAALYYQKQAQKYNRD